MKKLLIDLRCWLLGCEPHPQDPAPPEHITCDHCGDLMSYGQLCGAEVGFYYKAKDWCHYWLYRKWLPEKCLSCGKRYGDHSGCIPF